MKFLLLKKILAYSFLIVVFTSFYMPAVTVYACHIPSHTCPAGFDNTNKNKTPAAFDNTPKAPASSTQLNSGIKNPLGNSIVDIPSFIKTILGFVLIIGVPIIALAIIYAGFLFVTAQGNSEALKKAKTTLLYTLIGAALLLGSYVIANAIKGTVDDITSST